MEEAEKCAGSDADFSVTHSVDHQKLQGPALEANPAEFTDLSGQYYVSNETIEGRPTWVNENDENQMWFYRINEEDIGGGQIQYTYNWVLSDTGDRVACAPGYVDSPLYCTTFVYAGFASNGTSLNPQFVSPLPPITQR